MQNLHPPSLSGTAVSNAMTANEDAQTTLHRLQSTNQSVMSGIGRYFTRKKTQKELPPVHIAFPPTARKDKANYISTTKFTAWNFLPLNLYEQFGRAYNIYFLAGALSVVSGYSALSPSTQIFPLIIILIFSVGKEAIEDYGRRLADRKANQAQYTAVIDGAERRIHSQAFNPGDIIKLCRGEKCPADFVLLHSSNEDGSAFVETAELDGESNLKRRSVLPAFIPLTVQQIVNLKGEIAAEHPSMNLETFRGKITTTLSNTVKTVPIDASNLILKGTELRNTDYVYAMAIYSGLDTKIIKNLKKPRIKRSVITRKLNVLVSIVFVYNIILLVTSVVLEHKFWQKMKRGEAYLKQYYDPYDYATHWYLGPADPSSTSKHVVSNFLTFFGLFTYTIPSSLFVTIEIVRLLQVLFMRWDKKMVGKSLEGEDIVFSPNRSNLVEELAVVERLFSDKTGTLTMNDMRLSKWYVNNTLYDTMGNPGCMRYDYDHVYNHQQKIVMDIFSSCVLTCNDVIPAIEEDGTRIYEGQSPDETALIKGMLSENYILLERSKNAVKALVNNRMVEYEHLGMLEFTSDRKRMSVIVKLPDGKIYVFTKGADNVVLNLLAAGQDTTTVEAQLDSLSVEGLRTLVFAFRELSKSEYNKFSHALHLADISLDNRERLLGEAAKIVERDLIFLGASAIEDRLQNEVPETIEYIREMGIKIWLLTGDKMETAVTIGQSSRLLDRDMEHIRIKASTAETCLSEFQSAILKMNSTGCTKSFALIINGEALSFVFDKKNPHKDEMQKMFLQVGGDCHSVICCRVTPMQKAAVVTLVQKSLKIVSMAVGDGSNDVSMIQAANVGIGIAGREGAQAARAADFAIGEFRLLRRLMSVHGRFGYLRLSTLIFVSFYKNAMMITVQWWFGLWNLYSGQLAFEEMFLTLFNVLFTSLPPVCIGLFERDIREYLIAKYPQLYRSIKGGIFWSYTDVMKMFASVLWHSTAIFFSVWCIHGVNVLDKLGRSTDFFVQMYLFGTPTLTVVLLKMVLMMRSYNWITLFAVMLSLLLATGLEFLMEMARWVLAGTTHIIHTMPGYWICLILIPVAALGVDYVFYYARRQFWPDDVTILMENAKLRRRRQYVYDTLSKLPKLVDLVREARNAL